MLYESHSEWTTNALKSFDYLGADLFQPRNHAGNCNKRGSLLIFPGMGKRFQGFALQGSHNHNHGQVAGDATLAGPTLLIMQCAICLPQAAIWGA
jgi:hypothetical protein